LFYIIFAVAAEKTLVGVATCGERGGRAGSSYELDAARSIQSKSIPHILDLPGGFIWKALESSNVHYNEKRHVQ
jgi:hypothetical protein